MIVSEPPKQQYSEPEAAEALGVSVEQLRLLIRSHITEEDTDLDNVPQTSFRRSDLLLLKLLAAARSSPTTQR
jgi:hypothetical protein